MSALARAPAHRHYSMCTVSVMDDTDPDIQFDENGVCQYVHKARERFANEVFHGSEGEARLSAIVDRIRTEGDGRPFDCIVGVSGGVDSTYVALRAKELGLRPLAIHLDNGWNTEVAVGNIERLLRALDMDLETHVVDWREIRDLQRSFFKASVANIEVITDHAIFALLYQKAIEYGVKYILSGSNLETESIMPDSWGYDSRDARHISSIHEAFGEVPLRTFPLLTPLQFVNAVFVKSIKLIPLPNYGRYNKIEVIATLKEKVGYVPYERKHGESRFTRFFQEYYLPEKFGFDKRKAHFSSLIVAGQMTRDEALATLNKPLYDAISREIDIEYVTKKLGFSPDEWDEIMRAAPRTFRDFPNNAWMFDHNSRLVRIIRQIAKGEISPAAMRRALRRART